ncbi:CPA1 family monovalent cation:H+ antiporter [Chitinophaga skermanii]|uniref:CPA1 family monovalent cation:H+ antiporter n=1 Tax=Chitinophaga skermanii TaxID=331697 RepID=A0A327QRK9_9BACT|nr:Na+/H+ antiporter [Chitinophaga skermanii]RAJ06535.1 CPA1 family monovalent cation:H+ antiporter [Chitinophaga skermanii]
MHATLLLWASLVLVILFLVMFARKIHVSYPIVLVIGGLLLGFVKGLPEITIDPELIFVIFLPPLLYEAAWQTSWKDFWKWRRVIMSFAFIIVIFTAGAVGLLAYQLIPGFTLALGFLLGGIVSPPDAVSASSILKTVKVPRRMISILEGESLLNDAASLIIFKFALDAVKTGEFVWQEAIVSFFVVIIFGVLIGLAIALIFYAIHRWMPTTPQVDIVLTFVAPYLMYIVAEHFHTSGVLAVVSGGLFLATRRHQFLDYRSRIQGVNVWETIGFVLNGVVFMLIGLEMPFIVKQLGDTSIGDAIVYGLIISLALIVFRMLSTLGASVFTVFISRYITTADSKPGWRGPVLFGWTGMRGVVSLAAALSIPLLLPNNDAFPQRSLIIFITFVVILVTLVVQGLTLPSLVRWLKMEERDYTLSTEQQEIIVQKKMAHVALKRLKEEHAEDIAKNELLQNLEKQLSMDTRLLGELQEVCEEGNTAHTLYCNFQEVYLGLINEQRQLLLHLNRKAEFEEHIIRKFQTLLDIEEEKLDLTFSDNEE